MKRIALLHTVKSVADSFEGRLRAAIPQEELLIHNLLDDFLASDANARGVFTPENHNRLLLDLKACELTGAALIAVPVVAIDDAMSRRAVTLGAKLTVMATAQSTVGPTCDKLRRDAAQAGRTPELSVVVCTAAMDALRRGDLPAHDRLLKEAALATHPGLLVVVVVLAQASMAHLEREISGICGCATLSSPALCIEEIKTRLSL
ncbi:MAG: Asp/Glu racemase [Oscillospiraceae bacterium]